MTKHKITLRRRWVAVIIMQSLCLPLSVGCKCFQGWCGPAGPMYQQQAGAAVHDPFPQGDIGYIDPSMRPPGYTEPLPQPVRDQIGPTLLSGAGQYP